MRLPEMMTVFLFIGLWHLHFENKKRVSFYLNVRKAYICR
ncbi:hypothetical protein LCAUW4_1574 [Lacticaseibacillus casei UW4]|nr:hypothetical protein LCAUW4_1574 [Lacticaseibacillus casei UW4]